MEKNHFARLEVDNILIKILGIELPWNLKKIEAIHAADIVRIEIDYLRYETQVFPSRFI